MFAKILILALFSVCQSATIEPWWIKTFFPGVSFTGKYDPSNFRVDASALFPGFVKNSNSVWSPSYWKPYKMAYAQYWIDRLNGNGKAGEQSYQQSQAQVGQNLGSNQPQGATIPEKVKEVAEEIATQMENMNQVAQEIAEQVASEAQQQIQAVSESANAMKEKIEAEIELVNNQAETVIAEIEQVAESQITEIAKQVEQFVNQATANAEEVAGEIQNVEEIVPIVEQAASAAQQQIQTVTENVSAMKEEIEAQLETINQQAEEVKAQIDEDAGAKISEIAEQAAQFEMDLVEKFQPLDVEAGNILSEAAQLSENNKPQTLELQF